MKPSAPSIIATTLAASTALAAPAFAETDPAAVVETYADIALAGYEDSLERAKALEASIEALTDNPSEKTMENAREAWLAARIPYQQTEAFRFGNPIVDDWEGRVNAWPLDEGLIDYVDASYGTESDTNPLYTANVIANPTITVDGKEIDASELTPEFLSGTLQEANGIEANVATGYHAIEFLLWGQDLNGTGPGAGDRPYTDYAKDGCTHGHCDRRAAYLSSSAELLVSDLREMIGNWQDDGAARERLTNDPMAGISAILTGMGSLSFGELAGERMKLGLLLHDPEEEHDCFSDNTATSHMEDAKGIQNVYLGSYTRIDGTTVSGPSLADYVEEKAPEVNAELTAKLENTNAAMQAMVERSDTVEAYDQMIGEGNADGNATVQMAIDGLLDQTKSIERVIAALDLSGIELERSDSLDSPNAVFE